MVHLEINTLRPFVAEEVASPETPDIDLERFKRSVETYLGEFVRALRNDFEEINAGYIAPIVVASATVDLPNIGSNSAQFIDIPTAAPAPLGTHVISWAALTDATSIDDLIIQILVIAEDTIRVTMHNPTGGAINPDPITFQFITATAADT